MKCGVCKSEIPLNKRKDHLLKYHKLDYRLADWILRTDDELLILDIVDNDKRTTSNLITPTIDDHATQQFHESIDETLRELPHIITYFQPNNSLLSKIVTNQEDFILGIFLSRIISNFSFYCMNRSIRLSKNDMIQVYSYLFTKAPEFRESINESMLGVRPPLDRG